MARLELMDTVELMGSSDYRDRFAAEYIQTKIRYEKLKAFNTKIEAACRTQNAEEPEKKVPMPTHDCPASLLREQQAEMGEYLHLLEVRAVIEDIDLEDAMMYLEGKKQKNEKSTAGKALRPAKDPEIVRLEDPEIEELNISLEECEDDWDVVSEAVGRVIERGLFNDEDEEKLMAAAVNVLHKIKKLEEPCKESKKLTPDEIKNGLKNCISENCNCNNCPAGQTLKDDCECGAFLMEKALEYIKKLESEKAGET
jgi:hypothetical protein